MAGIGILWEAVLVDAAGKEQVIGGPQTWGWCVMLGEKFATSTLCDGSQTLKVRPAPPHSWRDIDGDPLLTILHTFQKGGLNLFAAKRAIEELYNPLHQL